MPRSKCSSKVTTRSGSSKKKKLKWIPMQMYRVPLSPEQAVLGCCDKDGKGFRAGVTQCPHYLTPPTTWVCGTAGAGTTS